MTALGLCMNLQKRSHSLQEKQNTPKKHQERLGAPTSCPRSTAPLAPARREELERHLQARGLVCTHSWGCQETRGQSSQAMLLQMIDLHTTSTSSTKTRSGDLTGAEERLPWEGGTLTQRRIWSQTHSCKYRVMPRKPVELVWIHPVNVTDGRKRTKLQHKVILTSCWQDNWEERDRLVLDWSTVLCVSPGTPGLLQHNFLTKISEFFTLNYGVLPKLEKCNIYSANQQVFTSTKETEIFLVNINSYLVSLALKQLFHLESLYSNLNPSW